MDAGSRKVQYLDNTGEVRLEFESPRVSFYGVGCIETKSSKGVLFKFKENDVAVVKNLANIGRVEIHLTSEEGESPCSRGSYSTSQLKTIKYVDEKNIFLPNLSESDFENQIEKIELVRCSECKNLANSKSESSCGF